MEYCFMLKAMGHVLDGIIREKLPDRKVRRRIRDRYREILLRAGDIGAGNKLLTAYGLAAWFIAMNRTDGLSAEENISIMESGMRKSGLLKAFMGDAKHYFSEKNMAARRAWSKATYERKYADDWVVDVLEESPDYRFGLDYRECGVCKLCRAEGCPELARYLCRLDFLLVELMGIHLDRTTTLAEGGDKCDFRFSAQK